MDDTKSCEAILKYADYNEYKYYFKPYERRNFNEVLYETALGYLDIDESKKNKYAEGFRIFFHHLHHDHVFSQLDVPKACNYISYVLRNKVDKDEKQSYDKDIFKIFERFVRKYKKSRSLRGSSCEGYMTLLDPDIFEQMHILYKLYDNFAVFAPTTKNATPRMSCFDFVSFIRLYNNFIIDKNPTNKHYYDVLKDFENRISKTISENKDKCYGLNLNLIPLKPYPLEQVEQSNMLERERHHHNGLTPAQSESTQLNQVAFPDADARGPQVKALLPALHGNNENHVTPRLGERATLVNAGEGELQRVLQNYRTDETPAVEDERGGEEAQELEETGTRPRLSVNSEDIRTRQSSPYPEYLNHPLVLQKPGPQNEDEGLMANMRNTITGVLESVEPAPILGVSGGMGALFLLFKYTPVGTFFRGGRVRARRIPSGFSGPFLGEFPDIQYYYGGNIGYGQMNPLAE